MNVTKALLLFCAENSRGILTNDEKRRVAKYDEEVDRLQSHYQKFRVGSAKKELDTARGNYVKDPSEVNRKAMDEVQASWLQKDKENAEQRRIIHRAIVEYCTKNAPEIFAAIYMRAANALAWLSVKTEFEARARYATFDHPYTPCPIAHELACIAHQVRRVGRRFFEHTFEGYGRSTSLMNSKWIAEVAKVDGPIWDLETPDPLTRKKGEKFRNFGQFGSTLFLPQLCEDGTLGYVSLKKKQGPDLVDCTGGQRPKPVAPAGPGFGFVRPGSPAPVGP